MKLIGNKTCHPNVGFSAGGVLLAQSRVLHRSPANAALLDIELIFVNWATRNVGGNVIIEDQGPDPIKVSAYIEYPSGTYMTMYSDGVLSASIERGASRRYRASVYIPPNTDYWIDTTVEVASTSHKFPIDNNGIYGPAAITGRAIGLKSCLIIGDSIGMGTGDAGDTYGNTGFPARALSYDVGHTKMATSSDAAVWLVGNNAPWNHYKRFSAVAGTFDNIIIQMGINDIFGAGGVVTLADLQAQYNRLWEICAASGARIFQCTAMPSTTSSDSWQTTGNQTVGARESLRVATNDWFRTVPSPVHACIEIADTVETARNSGLWKVTGAPFGCTVDGVHPCSASHAAAAGAINLAALA